MFPSFPSSQGRLIDSQLVGQILLCKPMNPPIFPYFVSYIFGLFLKRITIKELNNLRNLGQGRPQFILFPETYSDVRNIKVEGKLVFGELQPERFAGRRIYANAQMGPKETKAFCRIGRERGCSRRP